MKELRPSSRFTSAEFDTRISWSARGVFAYLRNHPHRRRFRINELVANGRPERDSEASTRNAVKELAAYGYIKMNRGSVEVPGES